MEVCGTHTVSIFRNGVRSLLPTEISLISGPGCPVCVTSQGEINAAVELARRPGTIVATYGDMLRVPGGSSSLAAERAAGRDVRVVTSAAEALHIAGENPDRETVFLAVGFETTSPATAAVVREAAEKGTSNFSVLCLHKVVPPALQLLASDKELQIDGFLLPGHVSTIIGEAPYRFLSEEYGIACAIAGFEAEDILFGVLELVRQIRTDKPAVRSLYRRAVRPDGNTRALKLLDQVFTASDASWRGLGVIPASGYALREPFRIFDAPGKLGLTVTEAPVPDGCRCGDVLSGLILPPECPLFGTACTPVNPVGPCMVSSEGSCAAHYKYQGSEIL